MDFYYLEETYQTLKQHKLRSILTGFGVTWGVFSLVILLGLGSGLKKGVYRGFEGMSKNSIWLWATVSKSGNRIWFTRKIANDLKREIPLIKKIGEQSWTRLVKNISYKNKHFAGAKLEGINIDYIDATNVSLSKNSRNFNKLDITQNRKVCLLGATIKKDIFANEDPIGKYLNIWNMSFLIIGYLNTGKQSNNQLNSCILIPLNTYQRIFKGNSNEFGRMVILLDSKEDTNAQKKIKKILDQKLNIHPSDKNAIHYGDLKKQIQKINNLFKTINLFIWSISICFLLSGVVGVGNMMLVVIKERIKEIGIRKVIGAKPKEILAMLMTESIIITLISGIFGMIIGNGIIKIANLVINHFDKKEQMMLAEMSFDLYSTIVAIIILVIAGGLAGFIPARKAVNMMPINALSEE